MSNKCKRELFDSWMNYGTVVSKCIELLEDIRCIKTEEVFDLLVSLKVEVKIVKDTRDEALAKLLQYNSNVLEKIRLTTQRMLIDKMLKWNNDKKIIS